MATWQEVSGEGFLVVLLHAAFRCLVLVGADAGPGPGRIPGACYGASGPYPHPDVQDPLSYQVMADDTEAYLDGVVGGPAHLVGRNDGAVVALLVARRHPDLVDRLLLIGQYCNSRGKVAGGLVDQLSAGGDQLMGFLRAEYDMVSADGPSTSRWSTPGCYGCWPLNPSSTSRHWRRSPPHSGPAGRLRRGDPRARGRRRDGAAAGAAGGAPGYPSPAGGEPGGGKCAAAVVPRRSDAGRQLAPPHNSVADRGLGKPASRKARWRCPRCHVLAAERMRELDDAGS